MPAREHGDHIGADLVGDIAVGGYPVGADDDRIDLAAGHQVTGHAVGDQCHRDAILREFPRGQPRALQERARFARDDGHALARRHRGADHAERGSVPGGRERPGVAMGQHPRPVVDQRRPVRAHRPVRRNVLG